MMEWLKNSSVTREKAETASFEELDGKFLLESFSMWRDLDLLKNGKANKQGL